MAEAKYGPKKAGHPSVGEDCPACHQPFEVGDYTTLVLLGPGDDEEAHERARAGRPYNAIALEVHWDCASEEARRPRDVYLRPTHEETESWLRGEADVAPSNLGGSDG